jgi:hypothetical protein
LPENIRIGDAVIIDGFVIVLRSWNIELRILSILALLYHSPVEVV